MEEKKRNRVQVGYTDRELAKLKLEYSKTNFQSFSKFLNSKTTNRYFFINEKNIAKLFFDLSKIGNNINQIAKAMNDVTVDKNSINFSSIEDLKKMISEIMDFQNYISNEKI